MRRRVLPEAERVHQLVGNGPADRLDVRIGSRPGERDF
jgi:hypothetical protein